MTLDELKLQVETAIRQILLVFKNNEREAIDFIASLIRKLMNVEFNLTVVHRDPPVPEYSKEHTSSEAICERPSSPDCEESGHVSSVATLSEKQGDNKRKRISQKIKRTNLQSKELGENENEQTNNKNNKTSVHCCICGYCARSQVALFQHISEHAGASASCRVCRHSFHNLAAYALHLAVTSCSRASCNGRQFVFHKTKHLDEFDLKKFAVCPFCAQSFSKASNLRLHMKRYVCFKREKRKRKTKLKCPWCKHEFSNQKKCDEHVQNSHLHKCTKCEKKFPTVSQMKAHRVTHFNDHKCKKCNSSFTTRRLLRTHSKEQHNNETIKKKSSKEHRCETCGWKTNRAYNLTRHTQSKHGECAEDTRTYACDRCPAVLRSWSTLKNHIAAHSDALAFICDHCKKGFKYRMMLKRHMRLHGAHTLMHKCTRCPRSFGRRDHLHRHEQEVHEMKRKIRPKLKELKGEEVKGMFVGEEGARSEEAEPQFLSLLDVQSGEMFTVPSQYAYNYLMVGEPAAPLGGGGAWEGMAQEAVPEVNVQYTDNIVLLTNVSNLPCLPPP